MGFATMSILGFTGAGIQMVSHGLMTAMFFACVGMVYDRAHSRDINKLGGMIKMFPLVTVAFVIASLVSMGMPGLSGFIAEFPIFMGVWAGGDLNLSGTAFGLNPATFYPIIAIVIVLGIITTAAYLLRALQKVFFGTYEDDKWHDMRPILAIDKVVLVSFSLILVVIGVMPSVISPIIESGVAPVLMRVQDAQAGYTVLDSVQTIAMNLVHWFGGV
jgi:NADH-quinone oxidoreductase subunit M